MSIEVATKIKLVSDALVLIGEKPSSSLSEDRYGVTVGANLFEAVYENELQSNRWRFAMNKKALSQLLAEPLNEWSHAYQLPTDMLLLIGTFPPSNYEVYGSHLYSNSSEVEVEYMFKPAVSALPAYFALLMRYSLAKNMVKAITESEQGVERFIQLYNQQRGLAMYADAQGRPNRQLYHSPFTAVR